MAYHIYTTEGVVLKRTNFGEANIIVYLLTYDLGVIIASAQAGRLISSKLRPSLQEYSFGTFSLVKGKNGWKLTNAVSKENFFFNASHYSQKFISQISKVLIRMMPGEEANREIFEVISSGFSHVKNISDSNMSNFEILCMVRVLYFLGYVSSEKNIEIFLKSTTDWDKALLSEIESNKKILVEKINKGLKESHL